MSEDRRVRSVVRGTGSATAGAGSYVVTGAHHGDVHLAALPVARSAYLEQVEQIFPWHLVGRDAELTELAEFCISENLPGYAWWQGPAWAGKSALMATFVLHPPPRVRVVSFFITARYAGQSDRTAFAEIVIEQLSELLGQPMPSLLTEATQRGWLSRLLKEATRLCREAGEHLVLVVDGLDEDRGVRVGSDAHSIAALLPAALPDGLRVVVAGRPNPPVPADVPGWHPLRDPAIVRPLSASPHAQIVRDDAERELDHLLYGRADDRNLLGFVVAAGGGLSSKDLAELTGLSTDLVNKQLRAVSGRTFSSRVSRLQPHDGAKVFVLAHEELQLTAAAALIEDLPGYRDQLHAWANRYRDQGWPGDTPDYLLRGYYRLLLVTGDLPRMVACATDLARLDRMLDSTGGDAAALAEIIGCQSIICEQDEPDLYAMVRLALTREHLADRNSHIPIALPAVWVTLSNSIRAEALARSITDLAKQCRALAGLALALVAAGELDRARVIVDRAETVAR
ncbi:hypothetical protein J5X84_44885, partial [Streptosporangiaceae bacterium NEAU-GS5]|nr:hypothetical protein [Streptosporangiaceae bacterium NEAU-GS5]